MRHTLLICLLVLALVAWLIIGIAAPVDVQAQFDAGAPAPTQDIAGYAVLFTAAGAVLTIVFKFILDRGAQPSQIAKTYAEIGAQQNLTISNLMRRQDESDEKLAAQIGIISALQAENAQLRKDVDHMPEEIARLEALLVKKGNGDGQHGSATVLSEASAARVDAVTDTPADKPTVDGDAAA